MVECKDFSVFVDNSQLFNLSEFEFSSLLNGNGDNNRSMGYNYIKTIIKRQKYKITFSKNMQFILHVHFILSVLKSFQEPVF